MPIKYYLQSNPITPDPNDQSARVVANQTLDLEGLIALVLRRGTLVTETDIRAVLTVFFDEVTNQVAGGNNIVLPLVNIRPGIKGVFASITDSYDSSRHSKKAALSAGLMLSRKMQDAQVEKITGYQPSPELLEYFDVHTQTANSLLTPGGIGRITGSELKYNPANAAEGIFLVSGGTETRVSVLAIRTEGQLLFSIPSPLAAGSYTLEVRRAYGTAAIIRTGTLNETLVVN